MYPSKGDPSFGVFVKNFYDYLSNKNGLENTSLIAIKGKPKSKYEKVRKYFCFYFKATCCLVFKKYDLVYVHFITYPAVPLRIASLFKEIPMAFNIHGSDWITHSFFAKILKTLAHPLIIKAKLVVVPSTVFKTIVKEGLPEIDEKKIKVSYSGGVDTNFFKPIVALKKEDSITIGYVSRIIENKGWKLFVEAVRLLKENGIKVKAIMAGGGSQENELLMLLNRYSLNDDIEYLGAVAQEYLPALYNRMDIFIFPTLFYESLGLVGVEAMACGTPVISTNQGGPMEYVEEGINGYTFEKGNVKDLCYKIEKYIYQSDLKKKIMSKNAIATSHRFERGIVMNTLMKDIEDIVDKQGYE